MSGVHKTGVITSDIEIGAVEIKNATTDDRAVVRDADTVGAGTDHVILVQALDLLGGTLTSTEGTHDGGVIATGPQILLEAKDYDGAALPNAVAEGDSVRAAGSLNGVTYVAVVNEDGSERPAYDTGTDSFKGFEVNPISEHHVEETLAAVTNGADDTFYYYVDMDGYRNASFQLAMDCDAGTVTATCEASIQDDGTAQAACTYQDITNDLFGVASLVSAAAPATDMWIVDTPLAVKFLRLKVVAATGATTGDWTIYHKRMY